MFVISENFDYNEKKNWKDELGVRYLSIQFYTQKYLDKLQIHL